MLFLRYSFSCTPAINLTNFTLLFSFSILLLFSHSVLSNSLQPQGLQHLGFPSSTIAWSLLCLSVWRRQWHPTPVLLPGKSHGQRSLVGCSPWGREESDMTEWLHFHFSLACIGEGNGNPLQCSCLENPRDGGAQWAAIYGVAQSQTRLKRLSSSSVMLVSWHTLCSQGSDNQVAITWCEWNEYMELSLYFITNNSRR